MNKRQGGAGDQPFELALHEFEASPTAGQNARLLQRLQAVDGLDLPVALQRVDGDVAMLVRLLKPFVAAYAAGARGLADASPARQRATSHALRGACALISATPLNDALRDFERAVADGNVAQHPAALAEQAAQLQQQLATLVTQLQAALGEPSSGR